MAGSAAIDIGNGILVAAVTGVELNLASMTVTDGTTVMVAQLVNLTFIPASNDSTNSSFAYTVNDAGTGVTSAVMNITVNPVNDAPTAVPDSACRKPKAIWASV